MTSSRIAWVSFHASDRRVPNGRYDVITGAKGDTKLACCKAICLGTGVPKVKGLGTGVPKAKGSRRRHKACMLQGNVLRHGGAEGKGMLKTTQNFHVARQCA
ncbi:hypothetical protein ACE6H2_028277 [Prunus campanulata]